MKTFVYTLLMTIAALGFVSCNRTETLTPIEEYLMARECRWEGNKIGRERSESAKQAAV